MTRSPPPGRQTRTHPRCSQADTSIRLILRACGRCAPPHCSCTANTDAFPLTEERIQSDRFHSQAETQLPCGEGWGGGQLRDANGGKMEGGTKFPCCAFPRLPLYCKLLTEQISLVFRQGRRGSRRGVSIAPLAVRHRRGLKIPPEHPSFDSFSNCNTPPLAFPDEAGGGVKRRSARAVPANLASIRPEFRTVVDPS